jgi:chromosome segregation ATPase
MNNEIINQCSAMNVSTNTFIRLREVYVINNLKKQISQLKKIISGKDEEIESFKSNIRCAKYSKLEYNYSNNLNQLIQIKKENESLRINFEEISSKYTEVVEENQKLLNSLNKYRSQYEELKIKSKILEDSNNELVGRNKYLEDKVSLLNKSIIHQPVQLARVSVRQKDSTINNLKTEMQDLKDKFKQERQRLERRIYYISEDFKKMRDALE